MDLVYAGSVKQVFENRQQPKTYYFGFTDDYSVFDWGKMPDTILNKGKALSLLGGTFFAQLANPELWQALPTEESLTGFEPDFLQRLFDTQTYKTLSQRGILHHFQGFTDSSENMLSAGEASSLEEAPFMKVHGVQVLRPKAFPLGSETLYQYEPVPPSVTLETPVLIPLEVVFRFGMTAGSSLKSRLEKAPNYFQQLGLSEVPQENQVFERPVLEYFTKLEPSDRFLSPQEALTLTGLSMQQFEVLHDTATLISLALFSLFSHKEILLWDGKLEFALSTQGIMLVDSIGPDELRLEYDGIQLSKEVLRQFYRNTPWEKAVKQAKQMAASQPGVDWKDICMTQLHAVPPTLSQTQREIANSLYTTLANHYVGETLFPQAKAMKDLISMLQEPQMIGVS